MRAEFRDMIQLENIDERFIPKQGARRRLIVIGDVHGCHEECALLFFSKKIKKTMKAIWHSFKNLR